MRFFLLFFLTSCAGLTPPINTRGASSYIAGGLGAKVAYDEVKKRLPSYTKILKLPAIELCYVEEERVICELNACSDDTGCSRDLVSINDFMSLYGSETIFIPKNSIYFLLSYIETFCVFKVEGKENPCQKLLENYKSIDRVLIYEKNL